MEITFFGGFQVADAQQGIIPFKRRKVMALLAFLALEAGRSHSRSTLMGLLWPELPEAGARNNLRVALSRLRGRLAEAGLDPELLRSNRHEIRLEVNDAVTFDVRAFQGLLDECEACQHEEPSSCALCISRLQSAVNLYTGPLLHGFHLDGAADFDEWLFVGREQRHLQVMGALGDLALSLARVGRLKEAIQACRRQLELDPLHDGAQRRLLRLLALSGESNTALAQFATFKQLLRQELGVEPDQEMLALVAQIEQGALNITSTESLQAVSNLPEELTPFIGREEEVAGLNERLASQTYRLITLVGPGGIGKTRLALQVARSQLGQFTDGVFFVGLVGVERVENVATVIAEAVGLPLQGVASPVEQLRSYLKNKQMLLLIDNIEHLLDSVDLLLEILRRCPQVTLLVTSRTQLNVSAEDLFRLRGLPVPGVGAAEEAARFSSVRLFCDRAHRLRKSFKLTPDNMAAVAEISRIVAGLPLALELAASWIRDLEVDELARSLTTGLDLLQSSSRDLPPQHRSIRAVFEYSWDLLSKAEQTLLAQLSVFRGSFSVAAAATVAGADTMGLVGLRMHSLIRRAGGSRYTLHELTRQFAAEKLALDEAGQAAAQNRHSRYYLKRVVAEATFLDSRQAKGAIDRLRAVTDNVRAAWQTGLGQKNWRDLDEALPGLMEFYQSGGSQPEGLRLCQESMAVVEATPSSAARDRFLCHLACQFTRLLYRLKKPEAIAAGEAAVAQARQIEEPYLLALALTVLGKCHSRSGHVALAEEHHREAVDIAKRDDFAAILVEVLEDRGHTAYVQTNYEKARHYSEEAITLAKREEIAHLHHLKATKNLACVALDSGDYLPAMRYYEYLLESFQALGFSFDEGLALHWLANMQVTIGLFAEAVVNERAAIPLFQLAGDETLESYAHHVQADALRQQGYLAEALVEGERAIALLAAYDYPMASGYAYLNLALVLYDLGRFDEADGQFALAEEFFQKVARYSCVHEVKGWRALVALKLGRLKTAYSLIEPLLEQLPDTRAAGGDRPVALFLACYQVLAAAGDGRASEILARGQKYLDSLAAKIEDDALRQVFLEKVPVNHEMKQQLRA